MINSNKLEQKTRSPMMIQWANCKAKAKDALVLFRMGDFYEAFEEDAQLLAKTLEINLTKRCDIPMAGVPVVSLDQALTGLAEKGIKIALVEQLKDPKEVKGIVPRDIVRVITPGSWDPGQEQKKNRYLVSIAQSRSKIAYLKGDLSTGSWSVGSESLPLASALQNIASILYQIKPAEVIISNSFKQAHSSWLKEMEDSIGFTTSILSDRFDHTETAEQVILEELDLHNTDGLGIGSDPASICATGRWIDYVTKDLHCSIAHFGKLRIMNQKETMLLDRITLRNLEITDPLYHDSSQRSSNPQNTLLNSLDLTKTAPGARLLRDWLLHPLKSLPPLLLRQESVVDFLEHKESLQNVRSSLSNIRDLERISAKITLSKITPPELVLLLSTLQLLPQVLESIAPLSKGYWPALKKQLTPLPELTELLEKALLTSKPPMRLGEGDLFALGYNSELDQWRTIRDKSQNWLLSYQQQLREELDIKTLRVGFTPAFGYYIEVSKGQASKMPESFQRRQTLVNSERFLSTELKEFEEKVLGAKDQIAQIERDLYRDLILKLQGYCQALSQIAKSLAALDVLGSFAQKALSHQYCRPELLADGDTLEITEGRHPIVEEQIGRENFISNSTHFAHHFCQMALITGPNMAGKSTYIRQVAVLTLMAQIGCFVPAEQMRLSVCDRIFTRVGASDDLARGQSTFMVEMSEAANILNHATTRSLVILDEIGRGTSTTDGLAIAQAIVEHLLTDLICRPKTLFATHYSELTSLQKHFSSQIKNFHITVKEQRGQITFMHSICEGSCDKSYGVHVAQLAGLPKSVITRAHQLSLAPTDKSQTCSTVDQPSAHKDDVETKKSLIAHALLKKIEEIDPQAITPIDALMQLQQLKDAAKSIHS